MDSNRSRDNRPDFGDTPRILAEETKWYHFGRRYASIPMHNGQWLYPLRGISSIHWSAWGHARSCFGAQWWNLITEGDSAGRPPLYAVWKRCGRKWEWHSGYKPKDKTPTFRELVKAMDDFMAVYGYVLNKAQAEANTAPW